MQKLFLIFFFFLFTLVAFAQENDYQSKTNKMYWKNRKPHPAYWQQDVHYIINAKLDVRTRVIEATEKLIYTNNSPYALKEIYFHLYQNAFTKGSYLTQLLDANKQSVRNFGKYQAAGLGTIVENLKVNGKKAKSYLDNTILKVVLDKSLAPGASLEVEMNFATFFDSQGFRRRMAVYNAWGFPHFNGVHWYPRICVYDAKKGWDLDQHLNKELYGDYGQFDVQITLAHNYVMEATGELQNFNEVFPGDLRQRLDIKNFANAKASDPPSTIIPYDTTKFKTWKYKAINVHDFAFTTDPSYRLGEAEWNGIKCIAIVQEPHCAGWQKTPNYITGIIKTFSEDFGMYEYPKIVAADANDGMEYPMITLDGGSDPDNHGLLIHEIGHNWFYGMIGNNETYRASLDEGFTQFLTSWGLEKLDGKYMISTQPKNKWLRKYKKPIEARERSVYMRYVSDVLEAEDAQLNTHSDDFHNAIGHENGYRLVYYKTATMLYNLQYLLGDSLFQKAMQHYVQQWKICHPYFEDFRASIIQFTQVDLNWFFDQWLETTKYTDYKIKSVKAIKENDSYKITLRRKGEMQMPLDVQVISKHGDTSNFYIPNQEFAKNTSAKKMTKWFGWGILNQDYSFETRVPGGIQSVEIDPSHRLADISPMNNAKTKGNIFSPLRYSFELDRCISQFPDRKKYTINWRPDIWWNPIDGTKIGIYASGNYLNYARVWDGAIWFNSHLPQYNKYRVGQNEKLYQKHALINYTFNYHSPILFTQNKFDWNFGSRMLDAYAKHYLGINYHLDKKNHFSMQLNNLYRYGKYHGDYLFNKNDWTTYYQADSPQAKMNVYLQSAWLHYYNRKKSNGNLSLQLRIPLPISNNSVNYNYAYLEAENIHHTSWRKLDVNTRLFARYGVGNIIPSESALYLSGANPEEMMENKLSRTHGMIPLDWGMNSTTQTGNFQMGGGLNLRAYNAYYALDENKLGEKFMNYKARSGAAMNVELEWDRFINWRPKALRNWLHCDAYLFADGGVIQRSTFDFNALAQLNPLNSWSKFRMDAGLGTVFTIKRWGVYDKIEPLRIRIDAPFFLSAPPYGQEYLAPRWLIGINKSF